ncbi:MAG: hypothetical protein IMX02_07540 [Limnochordaceae bacterium]|nr:hypothetical protein [Limnochordaceae bacterium]
MLPGQARPPVWEVGGLAVGIAMRYDLRFVEVSQDLARRGALAVVMPAASYAGLAKEEHWLTLRRARVIEDTFYTLGANQVGGRFCGRSAAFDPFGLMLADGGEREGAEVVPRVVEFEAGGSWVHCFERGFVCQDERGVKSPASPVHGRFPRRGGRNSMASTEDARSFATPSPANS